MSTLNKLEPKQVFRYFEEISAVPRASYNTKLIADYLEEFAKSRNLDYYRDQYDNIVIRKAATSGYECAAPIILQGHSDMVAEKTADSNHDFASEGLELIVDGDLLKANKTTLGGDDGIAVAIGLALLDDDKIEHPALEILITSNEEVGLLGATSFDTSYLHGKKMINLDSEEEGVLLAGCAGGVSIHSILSGKHHHENNNKFEMTISGLKGGHSGMEINKNRANANALMGRLLHTLNGQIEYSLAHISGGEKDNVITPAATAIILTDSDKGKVLETIATTLQQELRKEYGGCDEGITISIADLGEEKAAVLDSATKEKVIFFLMNAPFGVHKMSGEIDGLVETSSNIGVVKSISQGVEVVCSVRSMVASAKEALAEQIKYLTEFLGGEYQIEGDYPAWEFSEISPLRDTLTKEYQKMFGDEMKVAAIHAGLECGIFYDKMPDLDCVSIGPNIYDVHSPNEHLSISSTERMWKYLLKVLEALK